MGLDVYELYLEVEDAYGVRFVDAELGGIVTVGGMFDLTLAALREQRPERFAADGQDAGKVWEQLKALLVLAGER